MAGAPQWDLLLRLRKCGANLDHFLNALFITPWKTVKKKPLLFSFRGVAREETNITHTQHSTKEVEPFGLFLIQKKCREREGGDANDGALARLVAVTQTRERNWVLIANCRRFHVIMSVFLSYFHRRVSIPLVSWRREGGKKISCGDTRKSDISTREKRQLSTPQTT